jgi:hypothetical protein
MPTLVATLCILFILFGNVFGASLSQASESAKSSPSQMPPFISIPLLKSHAPGDLDRLKALGTAVVRFVCSQQRL